jgi:hypothetical protein
MGIISTEHSYSTMQRLIVYISGKVKESGYRGKVVTIAGTLCLCGNVKKHLPAVG